MNKQNFLLDSVDNN